jgi:hypothetical protein
MQKVQKTYTAEFKREAVRLAQTSGKPIAQVARETFAFPTPLFISGARNWRPTAPNPFQAAATRLPWKKRIVVSNGNWSEFGRNATF